MASRQRPMRSAALPARYGLAALAVHVIDEGAHADRSVPHTKSGGSSWPAAAVGLPYSPVTAEVKGG